MQPAPQKPQYDHAGFTPKAEVPAPSVEKKDEPEAKAPDAAVVDMAKVIENLSSPDFDVQARQMDEIAKKGMTNEADAVPYIEEDVFNKLIDIIDTDSTKLEGPSEQQLELRAKIAENDMAKVQAEKDGKDPNSITLPHQVSEQDIELANKVTPMEQAERNKEYAMYTISALSKIYVDEIQKETGNVVPFTDVPGMSAIVDTLRYSQNPSVKISAMEALAYMKRPEYKDELTAILNIAKTDKIPAVSKASTSIIDVINKN